MKVYQYLESPHLDVQAELGANFYDCVRDAVRLAANEWRNVTLHQNGKRYRINCNDLLTLAREEKE